MAYTGVGLTDVVAARAQVHVDTHACSQLRSVQCPHDARMKKPHPQLAPAEHAFYKKFFFIWCLPVGVLPIRPEP